MMRAGDLNLENAPVRTEMTDTHQIPIFYVCFTDESKSKDFLADDNLSQVYFMDEGKRESVIVNEISTEDSK